MMQGVVTVCPGKVLGPAYILTAVPNFDLDEKDVSGDPVAMRVRIDTALENVLKHLDDIKASFTDNQSLADLIEVQQSMLTDSYFAEEIEIHLNEGYAPHISVLRASKTQIDMLRGLGDEMMAARADDMMDASNRLAMEIIGLSYPDLSILPGPVILIGEEIFPSMLLNADLDNLKGIISKYGTRTSHVSILAASMGIPMIIGYQDVASIENDDLVFLDAEAGIVAYNPSREQADLYLEEVNTYNKKNEVLMQLADKEAVSADGRRVQLSANVIDPVALDRVIEYGMDGVGLFRTEFLYMNRSRLPSEEEQFVVYKAACEKLAGRPIIIRTMDIGGDKEVEALNLPKEDNPFLGYRAIRICLEQPELFIPQLRAILRASVFGNIQIMFPMVATSGELEKVLEILNAQKRDLDEQGINYDKKIKVGIMVEIPSAVVMMDKLAAMIDFVSIGSNDLVQYTFAVDRLNKRIEYLYNHMHPAILRMIRHTIKIASQMEIECSLCGEMGGDPLGMAALVALGLEKFSVNVATGLLCKQRLGQLDYNKMKFVGERMCEASGADEAIALLKASLPTNYR